MTSDPLPGATASHAQIPCFRCGVCCFKMQPLLGPEELRRLAADLGLSLRTFKRRYTRPYPLRRGWHQLKTGPHNGCIFLALENGGTACSIHGVRPQVCRQWEAGLDRRECVEGLRQLPGPPLLVLDQLYEAPEDRAAFVAAVTQTSIDNSEEPAPDQ